VRLLSILTLLAVLVAAGASEQALDRLGPIDTLIKNGRYAEAEKAARQARAEAEAGAGADSVAAAHVLNRLGEALIRQGKTDADTESVIDRALTIEERLEPGTRDLAVAMGNKAFLVESRGDFPAAREWYQRAFETMRTALGPNHRDTVMAEKDLGMAWNELGEYQKARTLVEEALSIRSKADPSHVDVAILRHNLGAIEWQKGDYAAAREAFTAAAAGLTRAFGPDHPHVASALEGLAVVQTNLGDHAEALAAYRRVLAIRQKVLPSGHPLIAQTYVNLGDVLMSLGNNRAALEALNRGLSIGEKSLGRNHPQLLAALTNLAVVLDRLGDHAAARRTLRRGIAIREKANGANDADLIIPLTQLANLLADDERWTEARVAYRRARTLGEQTRGADHPYVATVDIDEGLRLAAHGDLTEAGALITRARDARLKALGREHPDAAAALDAHARLAAFQHSTKDAISEALEAEHVARSHFQSVAAVLPESQALLFAEARTRSQDLAIFTAVRQPGGVDAHTIAQLWDAVIRSRALVLQELSWRRRFFTTKEPGRRGALDAAANARAQLAQLVLRGPSADHPASYPRELAQAREENDRGEERLAAESARYERDRTSRDIGFDIVRGSVPAGAALVSFVRYETGFFTPSARAHRFAYAAFVLAPGTSNPVLTPLGEADGIDALVEGWRRRIRGEVNAPPMGAARREITYREAAAALRRRLWDPVARHVGNASRILIVPDSTLHLLDFATLPATKGGYLAEAGSTLHYATAERDLVADRTPSGSGLLAVGAPAYDSAPVRPAPNVASARRQSDCVLDGTRSFAPLPESGREIEAIARLWGETERKVQLLSGRTASESAVRLDAPGRRVIHLATHGFVMGDGCAPGRGTLAARSSTARTLASNPLLGAGLVLAGASSRAQDARDAADDGILTAEEIGGLDLHGVEWAVLSACDSGTGGTRAGEGIFGLRRAFQMAGVRSVIVSLWPVDDRMAREWMERLYAARLQRHRSTDEAVAEANRTLLAERRRHQQSTHPVYWSGFVAAGDWR
jgi:CHAT domain-containing protein/tetratricopeptide (TPR) repeat protein